MFNNFIEYEECKGQIIRKIAVYFVKIVIDMGSMKTVTIAIRIIMIIIIKIIIWSK